MDFLVAEGICSNLKEVRSSYKERLSILQETKCFTAVIFTPFGKNSHWKDFCWGSAFCLILCAILHVYFHHFESDVLLSPLLFKHLYKFISVHKSDKRDPFPKWGFACEYAFCSNTAFNWCSEWSYLKSLSFLMRFHWSYEWVGWY